MEHPRVGICSSLCVGKEGKKKIKPLGPSGGPLIKFFLLREVRNLKRLCGVLPYTATCRVRKGTKRFHLISRAVVSYPTF